VTTTGTPGTGVGMRRWEVLRPHVQDGVPLARAARDAGVPLRTAQRWLAAFRAGGLAALGQQPRADAGRLRTRTELVDVIQGLALTRPRPSVATITRKTAVLAAERGWATPSYSTVREIVTAIDPHLLSLAHEGPTGFRDRYELVHRRQADRAPTTTCTANQLEQDLDQLLSRIDVCVAEHRRIQTPLPVPRTVHHRGTPQVVDLLIVDEAERLTQPSLEHLRDRFDRRATGLILIGMPGIDRSLSRHPQLYSRIGFAHQYRTLGDDELAFVLTRHWAKLGLTLDLTDFTDAQAVAAVGRITRGNFRLVHRLFAQVTRIMKINNLAVITSDVIETARGTLVIGEDAA